MQMRICHSLIVAVVSLGGLASAAPSNYFGTAIGRPCDPAPCAPPCAPPSAIPCPDPFPAPCGYCPKPCGCGPVIAPCADIIETTIAAPAPCAPPPCPCAPAPCGCPAPGPPAPCAPAPCTPPIKVAEAAPAEVVATKVVEPAPAEVIETTKGVAVAPHKRQCGCPCKCDVVEPPVTQINPAIVNTSTDVQPVDIIQPVQDIVQPVVDEHVKPVYSETVNPTQINHTVDPCTCACSPCSCTPEVPVRAE